MATVSQHQLGAWFESSRLGAFMAQMHQVVLSPLREFCHRFAGIRMVLTALHILFTVGIFTVGVFSTTTQTALMVATASVILLCRLTLYKLPFRVTMVDVWVLLFFLSIVVSTAFSSYEMTSIQGCIKFGVFFMGYVNLRVLIGQKPYYLLAFLGVIVMLAAIQSGVGFYQHIHHVQPLATWQDPNLNPEQQVIRIFGTIKPYNPNLLAGFLIPCVAGALGLTLVALVKKRWLGFVISLGVCMAIMVALVLTGSRGGYLAILGMGGVMFLYIGHLIWHQPELKTHLWMKVLWLLSICGVVGLGVFAVMTMPALKARFLSIFAMRENSSNSYRLNVWASTWAMIKDNWLVGIGPGNATFKQVYGLYMTPGYNALGAYSIVLEMWAEQGIIGLLVFMMLIAVLTLRVIAAVYSTVSLEQKLLIGALFVGIVGSLIYGAFDTIWYRPVVNMLFWLFVAGLAVSTESAIGAPKEVHA